MPYEIGLTFRFASRQRGYFAARTGALPETLLLKVAVSSCPHLVIMSGDVIMSVSNHQQVRPDGSISLILFRSRDKPSALFMIPEQTRHYAPTASTLGNWIHWSPGRLSRLETSDLAELLVTL